MGTDKSNSGKRSKKSRFDKKQGLWKTDEAKMVSAVDSEHHKTLILWGISQASFEPDQSTRVIERIKSITKREFPGVTTVSKVGASSKEFVVYLAGTTGKTLRQEIAAAEDILEKLKTFAGKLDQLHEQGVVHGDLRSETLLIQEDGDVAAAHFAVHHAIHDWTPNDRKLDPANFGKYAPSIYYAPELRAGENASPASDQYALACVVLEVTLGRPMDPMETPLDAVDRLPKSYQGEFATSLKKALAEAPQDRFGSCLEFLGEVSAHAHPADTQRQIRMPWKLVAAILIAPLLIAPTAKWLMAQSEQSRLDEAELVQLQQRYEIALTPPRENLVDASLASNLTARTAYERWYQQHTAQHDSAVKQDMARKVATWLRRWDTQPDVKISLASVGPDARRAFLFHGSSITDEGHPDKPMTIQVSGLPVGTDDVSDAKARFTVNVTGAKPVQQVLSLRPGSNPTFDVRVDPPNRKWSVGTQVAMSLELQLNAEASWTPVSQRSMTPLQFGAVEWKSALPTYLSVTRAVETKCNQSTAVSVAKGDQFRVKVTGSVNLFSTAALKKHKLNGRFGPSGTTATAVRNYRYITMMGGHDHWGAAILKIGRSGGWIVPSARNQPIIADSSGPIYVGINSVDHRFDSAGNRTNFLGDLDYWNRQGQYSITIEHQQVELPPGTSIYVRSDLIKKLR